MEGIFVPLIVFSFVALIVKMALDYNKWKKMHEGGHVATLDGGEDKRMGVGELRTLIQEAVESANAPLMERISFLEDQLRDEKGLLVKSEELKQLSKPAPERKS